MDANGDCPICCIDHLYQIFMMATLKEGEEEEEVVVVVMVVGMRV